MEILAKTNKIESEKEMLEETFEAKNEEEVNVNNILLK